MFTKRREIDHSSLIGSLLVVECLVEDFFEDLWVEDFVLLKVDRSLCELDEEEEEEDA